MRFHRLSTLFSLCVVLGPAFAAAAERPAAKAGKVRVYLGTYTDKDSKGIYRCELDSASGKLSAPELAGEATSPSFLALHPSGKYLYAVSEVGNFDGDKAGAVLAFAVDPASGKLTPLNRQSSRGPGPCHVTIDRAGRNVLVANYGGGSVAVLPVGTDGKLAPASSFQQHEGSSADKGRQEGPHAHSANLDPANRFAFVADLGLDKVLVYRFDGAKGTITPNDPPAVVLPPGSGPRHFAFHPDGKHAFVINELASTLTALAYDPERGALRPLQTVSTLPNGRPVKGNSTAEVVVHPSGKFVYGSNRGHNSIAVFAFDPQRGELTPTSNQGEGIKTPRNFNIDPSGRWLLVGNQDGNSVVVFEIDPQSGALKPTGHSVQVGAPVCIKFVVLGS